ncbi:hypothetical protein [Actinomadura verrucosospora]|uniref:hypothetical protein n=1 Tax=Actinomadura verrucosospora TaxID=46165 RepID=UPI001563D2BB|nr:hypothetical protein [Actinomadura verrucosospora]
MAPDQELDGSYREVHETGGSEGAVPEFVAPGPVPFEAEGPERASGFAWTKKKSRVAIAGAVAAAVVIGGAVVWGTSGSGDKGAPRNHFVALPAGCEAPSPNLLKQYMPAAEKATPDVGGVSGDQKYASCDWREPLRAEKGKSLTSRHLRVATRLFVGASGLADAKSDYQSAWRTSKQGTVTDSVGSVHNEAPVLTRGIGDEAFLHHSVTTTALGRSGTTRMVVRTQNAVVTIDFDGGTYPLDHDGIAVQRKGVPLDETVTRGAAQAIARDVTGALSACLTCVRR